MDASALGVLLQKDKDSLARGGVHSLASSTRALDYERAWGVLVLAGAL
jgi:hypothetical protein